MSSTNRGYNRHKSDYYVTPQKDILKFINEFLKHEPNAFNGVILDPCAGGDKNHKMSYPEVLRKNTRLEYMDTIDIRGDSRAHIQADYRNYEVSKLYDTIITNPPFKISREILNKGLKDVKEGGWVILLLRLNYFGSQKRFDLWESNMPNYVFVHHKRMSFTDDGRTDSIEYAHFCWKKGNNPEFIKLKVI